MKAQETIYFIDSLLFELWYTDDSKENFNKELFDGVEKIYSYIDKITAQNKELKKENKKLKANND